MQQAIASRFELYSSKSFITYGTVMMFHVRFQLQRGEPYSAVLLGPLHWCTKFTRTIIGSYLLRSMRMELYAAALKLHSLKMRP